MKSLGNGPRIVLCQFAIVAIFLTASLSAQRVITTAGGHVGDGGSALNATFTFPTFTAQDKTGNYYIADYFAHRIRKISGTTITTFAGTGISGFSGDGGLAKLATISYPAGLVFDSAGNLIFTDAGNHRLRKIDPSGVITSIAGIGILGYSGDGGPALLAELNSPYGVTLDAAGNIYFTDTGSSVVRKIDTSGIITTVAGNGIAGYGGDGAPATQAMLNSPRGLTIDFAENLYIADIFNHRVRVVDNTGVINTFAGNGSQGFSGDGGPATAAKIGNPRDVTIIGGQIVISNAGSARIRNVDRFGIIHSYAGSVAGFDGDGNPRLSTEFNRSTGLLPQKDGSILVTDTVNNRLRKVTPTGPTTTLAGGFLGDGGRATQAGFSDIENLAFDASGNYYIADWGGHRIRKVDVAGNITTVAGTGIDGYSGDGGPATAARLNAPFGVAVDGSGNLFIADTNNLVIRKVTSGIISTFASDPSFSDLTSLATDTAGNVYSADDSACVIRKITPGGSISVIAGIEFNCGFNGDGIKATTALLNAPYGVAVDASDNVYVGDTSNNRVRKVNRAGIISTIAGNGTCGFSGDGGLGTLAMLCNPEGVAVDASGNVYLGDYTNFRVRKISRNGNIITIAGSGNSGYNGENLPAASTNIDGPIAVGVDNLGAIYYADDAQNRVRKIH